jgi:hypothetical protein
LLFGFRRLEMAYTVDDFPCVRIRDHKPGAGVTSLSIDGVSLCVHRQPMYHGGELVFWLCPGCGSRASALYLRASAYRCRQCHGLTYRVQLESAKQRRERHARMQESFRAGILDQVTQLLALIEPTKPHS